MKTSQTQDHRQHAVTWILVIVVAFGLFTAESVRAQVDFSADVTTGYPVLTVTFTADPPQQGWGPAQWSFPGGAPSSASGTDVVVVNYVNPGTFNVSMSRMNPTGATVVKTKRGYITVLTPDKDYGDAPDDPAGGKYYRTLRSSGGASHRVNPQMRLGALIDIEANGQPSSDALGDDNNGPPGAPTDDEDGVDITTLVSDAVNTIHVSAVGRGYLSAWVDYNIDGDWEDTGEQVLVDEPLITGDYWMTIHVDPSVAEVVTGMTYARFRFSSQSGLPYYDLARDGEVEDYRIEIVPGDTLDFGDAPDEPNVFEYCTYLANDGARHPISDAFYLGTKPDDETDGQPDADATGDDLNGVDDEDGVTIPTLVPGTTVDLTVNATGEAFLHGWVDFNKNGFWDEPVEKVVFQMLSDGSNTVSLPVPPTAALGTTFARFRYSMDRMLRYDGMGSPGEVEDYKVEVAESDTLDFGDAPDDGTYHYMTLLPMGAYHRVNDEIYLGTPDNRPDAEPDGQPSPGADGDDTADDDDEDGVDIPLLVPGETAYINVRVVGQGILRGWFDWNANGLWDDPPNPLDPPDDPFMRVDLGTGDYTLPVDVPSDAVIGQTYVRFRYSRDRILYAKGPGGDGEVEDYLITIVAGEFDFGDVPDSYATTLASDGARHPVSRAVHLGTLFPDNEADGQPTAGADGDDTNDTDDEDGVEFIDPLIPTQAATIRVTMKGKGLLNAWIDWDGNGDFVGELVIGYFNGGGTHTQDFLVNVPALAVEGDTYARFRFADDMWYEYFGLAGPGEVEDYLVTIVPGDTLDWGDAPDDAFLHFRTLSAHDGARHPISDGIYLGSKPDGETDGQPTANAVGDDMAGIDDEDGVLIPALVPGGTFTITVTTHHITDVHAYLHGWIDFKGNGNWDDAGEKVFDGILLGAGTHNLNVTVPNNAAIGLTYARFRYCYNESLSYYGLASEGEVEDHQVRILKDFGDAPDDGFYHYATLLTNNGASHLPSDDIYLGIKPDGELDGNPDPNALGDDNTCADDEDGVTIPLLVPNQTVTIIVEAHCTLGATMFNGWIDFNGDGDWDEAGEQVFTDYAMDDGTHSLSVFVPPGAVLGPTYARFRYSPDRFLKYYGEGSQGEVEDYRVWIDNREFDFGDAPDETTDPMYPTLLVNSAAFHRIVPYIHLGDKIDAESDGQPDSDALGDDNTDQDDDDGVVFPTDLIPGETAQVIVTASTAGYLSAWADFNGDGDWADCQECIIHHQLAFSGSNTYSFGVPNWAVPGKIFMRFRFYTRPHLPGTGYSPWGMAWDGEVEDYVKEIEENEGPGGGPGAIKWYQPPLKNPKSHYPYSYWGWDELSVYSEAIIADDWFCADSRPVTGIRWWGSYADWDSVVPPPNAPERFHIAIWSDIPQRMDRGATQPGTVVWEKTVSRSQLDERAVGSDFYYGYAEMGKPDTCFQYSYGITQQDWFQQQNDSTYYWLSVSAIYEGGMPYSNVWGWKTRDRYFRHDGLRILQPEEPALDSLYRSGEIVQPDWDMSFVLYTTIYEEPFDYGDAQDPEYPTEFESNGAHHMVWPGIYLGEGIDNEPDGVSDEDALYDDTEGSDDEDGVVFATDISVGDIAYVTVNASEQGYLSAWIDYNTDGDWDDAGEQIFIDMPLYAGGNNLAFSVPRSIRAMTTYARFRFSPIYGVTPKGLVIGGEVEDYEVTISWATGVDEDGMSAAIPNKFELMQNYPNPFNPETTIKFQLPQAGEVLIVLYDIFGREVRTLVHGEWAPGYHSVVWDGRNRNGQLVASGMYFYQIAVRTIEGQRKKYSDVKKMIFMK